MPSIEDMIADKVVEKLKPLLEAIKEGNNPQPVPEPTPTPTPEEGNLPLFGMNISGLGNNPWLPAINGLGNTNSPTHHRQPEEKALLNYVKAAKGNPWIARLPIAMEYFITGNGQALFPGAVKQLRDAMDLMHKHNGKVIIDLHNYFRFWKKVSSPLPNRSVKTHNDHLAKGTASWTIIGEADSPISVAGLANFWQRMAMEFKDHPALLAYGLMNEPHNNGLEGVDIHAKWPAAAQACIDAIRRVDNKAYITVALNFWSSAKVARTYSMEVIKVKDTADKLLFEAHQYFDNQGNGGGQWKNTADPVSADRGVMDWADYFKILEDNNLRGFAGEFGGPHTAGQLIAALDNLYDEFEKRRIPATQWLSGVGFSDSYPNGMNTQDGTLKPNAGPLIKRIGKTVSSYGPRK